MSASPADSSNPESYILVITLVDSEPEIWREIMVPTKVTLQDLHTIIQKAMGWEDQHDYKFTQGVGQAACDLQHGLETLIAEAQPLYYNYDFQSGWLHRLEWIRTLDGLLLGCVRGKMACPPEGTDGVWGYDDFLDRLEDSEDPDYLMLIEKYGTFDADVFDVQAANDRVRSLAKSISTQLGAECQPVECQPVECQTTVA